MNPPTNCPLCNLEVTEKKGVARESGKPYHFWGCSGWPGCKYVFKESGKSSGSFEALKAIQEKLDQIHADIKKLSQ